jgi:hypothetical protein
VNETDGNVMREARYRANLHEAFLKLPEEECLAFFIKKDQNINVAAGDKPQINVFNNGFIWVELYTKD